MEDKGLCKFEISIFLDEVSPGLPREWYAKTPYEWGKKHCLMISVIPFRNSLAKYQLISNWRKDRYLQTYKLTNSK